MENLSSSRPTKPARTDIQSGGQSFGQAYDPKQVEQKIYQLWEKSGYFNPDKLPNKKGKPYSITLAPPNITGSLHMGHALEHATSDALIRFKRMQGFQTLWLPGTDHAGIATQNVVEKDLKKQGISRHDLGQEKFLEKIWEWKEKYGNIILDQMKKLGASCDWSRARFTMDTPYQEAVKEAFLHYYKKKWIYQGERVISWCVRCQTSLSDLELEYTEEKGKLWFIKYPLKDNQNEFITVATTRPETMLGDTAIAVNPKDKKYKNLIGQKVILPIQNREIPIVADQRIEMSFGTGAVKVTPAHDALDEQIGLDHHLSAPRVIDELGKMTEEAGEKFAGLKILEARETIIKELEAQNLLEKIEDYTHNVAKCYRCGSTVEPMKSQQWFLKMDELAKMAIKAVKSGQIKFYPRRWEKIYFAWLANIKDWCISRQIWWGHKIPIEGINDVLDTWFSSALWPFATLGWPLGSAQSKFKNDFKKFYPTNTLTNDRGIINLWDARMIFSSLEFTKKIPFKDLLIHATILTKDGKRMSKSLGTGIDPMVLIEQYGADATRFGLIWQAMGGQDIHWSEEHVIAGKKFCNKIWNAARFATQQFTTDNLQLTIKNLKNLTAADKDILKKLDAAIKTVTKNLNNFEFGPALHNVYDFFWHDFCDKYIEISKIQTQNQKLKNNTEKILLYTLATSLKIIHPFMPFVTEEIYQKLPIKNLSRAKSRDKKLLIIENWPR